MGFSNRINKLWVTMKGKILYNTVIKRTINPQMLKMTTEEANTIIGRVYSRNEENVFGSEHIQSCNSNECDVSIIIPVYNGEKYLKQCIESILQQRTEYSFEMVCIDDGSTDSSQQILNTYSTDVRIRVVSQKNMGISGARNHGLRLAKGKYVLFVDNDDFINEDFIQTMMNYAIRYDADVVKCGYRVMSRYREYNVIESGFKVIKNDMKENLIQYSGFIWGSLIKREMFKVVNFPVGYWYEDMITRLLIYRMCNVFVYVNRSLYRYRMHGDNASRKVWDNKNYKSLDQYFLADKINDYARSQELYIDQWVYKLYLYELGRLLYIRTIHLEKEVRQAVFKLASDLICRMNGNVKKVDLNKEENILNQAFLYCDFELWESVCKYYIK